MTLLARDGLKFSDADLYMSKKKNVIILGLKENEEDEKQCYFDISEQQAN